MIAGPRAAAVRAARGGGVEHDGCGAMGALHEGGKVREVRMPSN
jgi:hypothetical protein